MFKLIGALFLASCIIQLLNYLFIKYSGGGAIFDYFKVVLLTLPLQVLCSMTFAYFYSHGMKVDVSYFQLSMLSIVGSLTLSSLVSAFILKGNPMSATEWLACGFTMIGIALFLLGKSEVS